MKKYNLRPLIAAVVAACALLSIGVSSASAWTDPGDETVTHYTYDSRGAPYWINRTWQYSAWIQPSQWTNPRGGTNADTLKYAYALNGSAGNASVCVVVHLYNLDGPSVGLTCGTNGASTGTLYDYVFQDKWVFAYNDSSSARTMIGGWVECSAAVPVNC